MKFVKLFGTAPKADQATAKHGHIFDELPLAEKMAVNRDFRLKEFYKMQEEAFEVYEPTQEEIEAPLGNFALQTSDSSPEVD